MDITLLMSGVYNLIINIKLIVLGKTLLLKKIDSWCLDMTESLQCLHAKAGMLIFSH